MSVTLLQTGEKPKSWLPHMLVVHDERDSRITAGQQMEEWEALISLEMTWVYKGDVLQRRWLVVTKSSKSRLAWQFGDLTDLPLSLHPWQGSQSYQFLGLVFCCSDLIHFRYPVYVFAVLLISVATRRNHQILPPILFKPSRYLIWASSTFRLSSFTTFIQLAN